jgi:large subunit ribosomal protein L1
MDNSKVVEKLNELMKSAKERKFVQTFDLIINLKGLNLKKPDEKVDFYQIIPKSRGKEIKICALIGGESKEAAEKAGIDMILVDDFKNYSEKRKAVALARKYDYFIAQANLMGQIATAFGRVFGVRGKMPNPKAGCVFPPKANLEPLVAKLKKTVRVVTKSQLVCQVSVGNTKMDLNDVADNIISIYDGTIHHLPQEKNNLRNIKVKLTMSKSVDLGGSL